MFKKLLLVAFAAAVLVPLTGCGWRRCNNRCSGSNYAPPLPPPPAGSSYYY